MNFETLQKQVVGDRDSFVLEELAAHDRLLKEEIQNSRILVVGAAGSIGGSFVKELMHYQPASINLVDISENNLVEIVRDLRGSGLVTNSEFKTFSVDYLSREFALLMAESSFDYVLNFAAMKHVRSERDSFTLMRLLRTNVIGVNHLAKLCSLKQVGKIFSVSSDKAVNPGNLMGASKALMEHVLVMNSNSVPFSSTRFANVAYSDGSLLHGFLRRLEKRQPISAPSDVRRYFISHKEAGQLCLLGCFLGRNKEIFYPKFEGQEKMQTFADIGRRLLEMKGMEAFECSSEEEAISMSQELSDNSVKWPCYFTESNTSGEKPFEEFTGQDEDRDLNRFQNVGVVTQPNYPGKQIISDFIQNIESLISKGSWTKNILVDHIRRAVPDLRHQELGRNLDSKL